jgi:MoaA/NifB/PqqE/SkfB family radical SAM enzyme
MDLMISSMCRDGKWNCNQHCIHCYAAGEELAQSRELTTDEWEKVIDKCRQANIPQLTFTGGEPTLRTDLVELVEYAKWFVTRLNSNGVLLTKELCENLYNASLDSVQITLYSSDDNTHNYLVGENNWEKTVEGIRNAVAAGFERQHQHTTLHREQQLPRNAQVHTQSWCKVCLLLGADYHRKRKVHPKHDYADV